MSLVQFRGFRQKGGGKRGATGPPAYFLPEELYSSFEPKSAIPFWRTRTSGKNNYKTRLGGLGNFLQAKFEAPETPVIPEPLPKDLEPKDRLYKQAYELKELDHARKRAEYAMAVQRRLLAWDPHTYNEAKTTDSYLTLFIGRLDAKVTEEQLKAFLKEQSGGGEITQIRIIRDLKHPKRSYAFAQFADEKALQKAYHQADGVLFFGRHIVVDVERGRTVRTWIPRRFGGGLGGAPRIKGHILKRGRGPPEPPPARERNIRKRPADTRPHPGERPHMRQRY